MSNDEQLEEMYQALDEQQKKQEPEEKKGYISSFISGVTNATTYVAGGVVNIGKGVFHTTTGLLGIGPGVEAGISKMSNGVSSVVDGVVTGTIETVTGKDIGKYSDDSSDMLRRYSFGELREMAKNNPSLFAHRVTSDFGTYDEGEDALRLLRVIAPEIKNWPKKEQTLLLNGVISSRSSHAEEREAVEILLEAGVNPNIGVKEIHHHTKNEIAPFYNLFTSGSYKEKRELIELFLKHGADPNMVMMDEYGKKVPLHHHVYNEADKELLRDYIKPNASASLEACSDQNTTHDQSQRQSAPAPKKTGGRE